MAQKSAEIAQSYQEPINSTKSNLDKVIIGLFPDKKDVSGFVKHLNTRTNINTILKAGDTISRNKDIIIIRRGQRVLQTINYTPSKEIITNDSKRDQDIIKKEIVSSQRKVNDTIIMTDTSSVWGVLHKFTGSGYIAANLSKHNNQNIATSAGDRFEKKDNIVSMYRSGILMYSFDTQNMKVTKYDTKNTRVQKSDTISVQTENKKDDMILEDNSQSKTSVPDDISYEEEKSNNQENDSLLSTTKIDVEALFGDISDNTISQNKPIINSSNNSYYQDNDICRVGSIMDNMLSELENLDTKIKKTYQDVVEEEKIQKEKIEPQVQKETESLDKIKDLFTVSKKVKDVFPKTDTKDIHKDNIFIKPIQITKATILSDNLGLLPETLYKNYLLNSKIPGFKEWSKGARLPVSIDSITPSNCNVVEVINKRRVIGGTNYEIYIRGDDGKFEALFSNTKKHLTANQILKFNSDFKPLKITNKCDENQKEILRELIIISIYSKLVKDVINKNKIISPRSAINDNFVYSILAAETRFNPNLRSHTGVKGIMQVADRTFTHTLKTNDKNNEIYVNELDDDRLFDLEKAKIYKQGGLNETYKILPEVGIPIGINYLFQEEKTLMHVRDPNLRLYLLTRAYNLGGAHIQNYFRKYGSNISKASFQNYIKTYVTSFSFHNGKKMYKADEVLAYLKRVENFMRKR